MFRKHKDYVSPSCVVNLMDLECTLLAESVNNNCTITSAGHEIGVDVTFESDDYVNTNWESGTL